MCVETQALARAKKRKLLPDTECTAEVATLKLAVRKAVTVKWLCFFRFSIPEIWTILWSSWPVDVLVLRIHTKPQCVFGPSIVSWKKIDWTFSQPAWPDPPRWEAGNILLVRIKHGIFCLRWWLKDIVMTSWRTWRPVWSSATDLSGPLLLRHPSIRASSKVKHRQRPGLPDPPDMQVRSRGDAPTLEKNRWICIENGCILQVLLHWWPCWQWASWAGGGKVVPGRLHRRETRNEHVDLPLPAHYPGGVGAACSPSSSFLDGADHFPKKNWWFF